MSPSLLPSLFLLIISPYALFVILGMLFTIAILPMSSIVNNSSSQTLTPSIPNVMTFLQILPPFLLWVYLVTWTGPHMTLILGHLLLTTMTFKLYAFFVIVQIGLILSLRNLFHILTSVTIDTTTFLGIFCYFAPLLLLSNSLLSFIFMLELLTTQIFVMIVLWDSLNRENISLVSSKMTENYQPYHIPFKALFFFFWTSFVIAILLFLILNYYLSMYTTSDWFTVELLSRFILNQTNYDSVLPIILLFVSLLLTMMLKFALTPFFFWKPIFFSALHISMLFVYTIFFYFMMFVWVMLFWFSLNSFLTQLVAPLIFGLLVVGTLMTLALLSDSTKIRNLIAISSIFNTLLIWFALSYTDLLETSL